MLLLRINQKAWGAPCDECNPCAAGGIGTGYSSHAGERVSERERERERKRGWAKDGGGREGGGNGRRGTEES